jgi:hypothetical protein
MFIQVFLLFFEVWFLLLCPQMDAELAMDQEAAKGSRTRCVTLAWRLKIVASKDVSFFLFEGTSKDDNSYCGWENDLKFGRVVFLLFMRASPWLCRRRVAAAVQHPILFCRCTSVCDLSPGISASLFPFLFSACSHYRSAHECSCKGKRTF